MYGSLFVGSKILVDLRFTFGLEELDESGCVQLDQPLLYDLFQLLGRHHLDVVMARAVIAEVTWELALEASWGD